MRRIIKILAIFSLVAAVPLFITLLSFFKSGDEAFFEAFATEISPFLAAPLIFINGLFPFSVTEAALYLLLLLLLYILYLLLRLVFVFMYACCKSLFISANVVEAASDGASAVVPIAEKFVQSVNEDVAAEGGSEVAADVPGDGAAEVAVDVAGISALLPDSGREQLPQVSAERQEQQEQEFERQGQSTQGRQSHPSKLRLLLKILLADRVWKQLKKVLIILLVIAVYAYSSFQIFHAFNYRRPTMAARLGLSSEEPSLTDLKYTATLITAELQYLCNGEVTLPQELMQADGAKPADSAEQQAATEQATNSETGSTRRRAEVIKFPGNDAELLNLANYAYRQAGAYYSFLNGQELRAKPVSLSYYWSFTATAGMYMPLFKEANVNVNQPAPFVLFSAAHELAHVRNFAREDECNFLAFLTLSMSDDKASRYAAYINAWIYVGNALYKTDRAAWQQLYASLPEQVTADLRKHSTYWEQFRKQPAATRSQQLNDKFLKAHGQSRGILSYDDVTKLLVALFKQAENS